MDALYINWCVVQCSTSTYCVHYTPYIKNYVCVLTFKVHFLTTSTTISVYRVKW